MHIPLASGHQSRYQTGGVQERERAGGETRQTIPKNALQGIGGAVGRKERTANSDWLEARLHEQPTVTPASSKLTEGHEAKGVDRASIRTTASASMSLTLPTLKTAIFADVGRRSLTGLAIPHQPDI